MDKTTERIVTYATGFSEADMSESAIKATVDHLFDSIACAIPGSGTDPARITAKVASTIQSDHPATVFGYGVRTSPEIAALSNAGMIRTYDWNDGGPSVRGGGHSSDMISGVLASGEATHSSGMQVLTAIALAYEVLACLGYEPSLNRLGFDQGTFMNVAVALAAGKLYGLNEEQLANAASLGIVPNVPMSVSRWGDLSMMKGYATSFATRSGVFAAMLAKEGFTSAPEPFEGIYGFQHLTGPFEVELPLFRNGTLSIENSSTKYWPAEGNVQGLLELVPRIRAWTTLDEIDSIDVTVAEHLVIHLADEPKYDPHTRETADHSLPYMLMIALLDGKITLDSYLPQRYLDPAMRPLMRKVHVIGSQEYDDQMRAQPHKTEGGTPKRPAHIKIRKTNGDVFEEEVPYPIGHSSRPLTRENLNEKLTTASAGIVSDEQREQIRDAWWNVAKAADINEPMKTVVGFRKL